MISQLTLFDYASLDSETRIVVQQRTEEIKTLMRRTAQDIIEIGQKLIDVKARLGHGNFGAWLDAEFGWTPQLGRQYMNVAEKFSGVENETLFRFGSSALRLLASPSTPEEAIAEAVERAEAGETITYSIGKEIVDTHKKEQSLEPDKTDAQEPPKQETSLNFSQVDAQVIPPPSTQGSYTPDVSQFTAVGGHIVPKSALEPMEGQSAPSNNTEPDDSWSQEELSLLEKHLNGKTIVISFSNHKNLLQWAEDHDVRVWIDRRSEWGNPFLLPSDGDRDTVCDNYRDAYLPKKPSLLQKLPTLKGKILVCHCHPLRCHGDALIVEVEK